MNYEAWRFWIWVVQLLINLGFWIYVWWSNREKVTTKRFEALEKSVAGKVSAEKFDTLKERVSDLESEVKRLPSPADHKELAKRIEDVHADLHEISGALKGLTRAVDLMNEHLLNGGGRK